jgi:hypothetical protein
MIQKDAQSAYVSTPEDTILSKLEWDRKGESISDTQWMDVLGILKVQGSRLDMDYLQHWAHRLNLEALLRKALEESEVELCNLS